MKTRIYSFKDVDMLLASRIIATNFRTNLVELEVIRTDWNEDFADKLAEEIDTTIDVCLGVDKRKELKEATDNLTDKQISVKRDLSFLKTQIKVDHPDQSEKILSRLGYSRYGDKVKNGDQEALIEMLYVFKKEMNDSLKAKICSGGINPAIIERVIQFADQMKLVNTLQETLKKTTKQFTGDVVDELNRIYQEVSGICKIAFSYFQMDPLKQEQFSFSGIVRNMNQA